MQAYLPIMFPDSIGYGSQHGPGFRTALQQLDSGYVGVSSKWTYPRRRYRVNLRNRSFADINEILNLYHVVGGMACSFLLRDRFDFTSAADHRSEPTALDQVITPIDGIYRLMKTYSATSNPQVRYILKPTDGTILLADGGTPISPPVDLETGIITYTPTGELTAGFKFSTVVRFNSNLRHAITDYDAGAVNELELIETRLLNDAGYALR